MDYNTLCFLAFVILFVGYLLLEGFDFGAGMLLLWLGKSGGERQAIIQTMAPVWDGNEVWLIAAGALLFAAFPDAYATLFSGMYLALLLVLVPLILRGVAFEFRDQVEDGRWRTFWDWTLFAGSSVPPVVWGIFLGNLLRGLPIDGRMEYTGTFWDLLSLYTVLCGGLFVLLFLQHGAVYLCLKLSGPLSGKAGRIAGRMIRYTLPAVLLYAGFTYAVAELKTAAVLGLLLLCLASAAAGFALERYGGASIMLSGLAIATAAGVIFVQLYPRIVISRLEPRWSLDIYNAAANALSLQIMGITMAVVLPVVFGFESWKYYVFRQRIAANDVEGSRGTLAGMNRGLRELLRRADCLSEVMRCMIRGLRRGDGVVINRLHYKYKKLLLGKRRRED